MENRDEKEQRQLREALLSPSSAEEPRHIQVARLGAEIVIVDA